MDLGSRAPEPLLTLAGRAVRPVLRLPAPVLHRLVGGAAPPVDGQVLDAGTQVVLAISRVLGGMDYANKTPARARRELAAGALAMRGRLIRMKHVADRTAPGAGGSIAVRLYVPHGLRRPAPLLLYFHGGGWVVGSVATHDPQCRLVAAEARCVVASVEYRLAPEHPFPAAVDDALDAWRWVTSNARALDVDPARLAVGGDSAGGNLAAVLCQQVRLHGLPLPAFQLLVYPVTDLRRGTASYQRFGTGYLLEASTMGWFIGHYLRDPGARLDPRASPLLAADLAGLPPALVVTAGFDPLRDEGRAYAERLQAAGVAARHVCYGELIHGFGGMAGSLPRARSALVETARALGDALR